MKTKSYFLAVLLGLLFSLNGASAVRFDEAQKFIFYSVLEGLYEDGVSTEDV